VLSAGPLRQTVRGFAVQGRVPVREVRDGTVGLFLYGVRRRKLLHKEVAQILKRTADGDETRRATLFRDLSVSTRPEHHAGLIIIVITLLTK